MIDSRMKPLSAGLLQNLTSFDQWSNDAVLFFLSAEFNPDTFKSAIEAYL